LFTVASKAFDLHTVRQKAKRSLSERDSCHNHRLARAHDDGELRGRRDGGERGHVAAADIFGQGCANGASDFHQVKFHEVRMNLAGIAKKKILRLTPNLDFEAGLVRMFM
jgi:hypothetical protein